MLVFLVLLQKLAPLYMNILLGFLAGRLLLTPRDVVARIMFYLINPLIMFNGILNTQIDDSILSLPIVVLFISCFLCLLFFWGTKTLWNDSTRNLIAFSAGSGNTGYFGLPLALVLFDNQGEGIYMMALLGVTLYENTLGFYICAKGTHGAWDCFKKLLQLPTLYAFFLALGINWMGFSPPHLFLDFMCHIKGTYTVLGMMIIGLGIAHLHHFKFDFKFVSLLLAGKFLLWPALILGFIWFDSTFWGIYNPVVYQALILLSIVPVAVNSVIIASILQAQPEKAAVAVLLSTLIALFYVPLMIIYFIGGPELFSHLTQCPI